MYIIIIQIDKMFGILKSATVTPASIIKPQNAAEQAVIKKSTSFHTPTDTPDDKNIQSSTPKEKSRYGLDQAGNLKHTRIKSTDRWALIPRASFFSQAEIFNIKGKREEEQENERIMKLSEATPLRQGQGIERDEVLSEVDEIPQTLVDKDGDVDRVMILWENVLLVSIVYNCMTICFFLGLPGFPTDAWLYLEFLTEIFMVIDIFIRYVLRRYLVNQRKTLNLLHRKSDQRSYNIALLILSSIPTSMIIYPVIQQEQYTLIWPAIIRALKLYRIKQLNLYFDIRDIRAKKDSFIRTMQAGLYIILVTHMLSCFWLFIGRVDPQQDLTWMKLVLYDAYEGHVPDFQKYIDSVLFVVSSMTGLGFGYIYPRTDLEYAMQSIIMLLGVSTYANFFAFFAVTIYNRNKQIIENMMRFEESKKLAKLRGFPQSIRYNIREYYNNLRLKYESMTNKFEIMSKLPNSLRSEMSLYLNTDLIQKINFFQFADPALILNLSKCMYPQLGLMDQYVFQQGEVATKMFFIKSGIVQVLATDEKTVIALMTEGGYFGEIGIFLLNKRSCSIKAKTVSVFYTILKEELLEALKEFPLHLKYLKAVGKQRLKTTDPQDLLDEEGGGKMELGSRLQQEMRLMRQMAVPKNTFGIDSHMHIAEEQLINPGDLSFLNELYDQEKVAWNLTQSYRHLTDFIIIPFSKLFNIWSPIFVLAFLYDILYVPFSIGLSYEVSGSMRAIDIASIIIFFIDSIMRPLLAINKRNEIDTDKQLLFRQYVHRHLILDLLATIPFDYLLSIIDDTPIIRYFRILRLMKFYRLFELVDIIRQHTTVNVPLFRISLLFITFILMAHWFNCILLLFARWELYQERRFDGKTLLEWLYKSSDTALGTPDQWSPWELYFNLLVLCCCYMGSIVYGDIIPFTLAEESISIIEMLIGRVFMSFLFAEVAGYVSQQYSAYDDHVHQQGIVMKWTQLNGLSKRLRHRIQKYFDLKWQNMKGIREEELILDLPNSLKKNVKNFLFDELIQNCDVFPRESVGTISTITAKLQRKLIPKDEYIIRQGELAQEMYFIMKGEVRIVTQDGVTLATLRKNMHFGEMALIQEQISVRSTSAIANNNVTCAMLTCQDFKLICANYPEFKTRMQEIVQQRAQDSLKKGVKVTNQAQRPTVKVILKNLSVNKGITSTDLFVHNATKPSIMNTGGLIELNNLSIVEEESKRHDSMVQDDIELCSNVAPITPNAAKFTSPRNPAQKVVYKRNQSEFRLQKKVCLTRLSDIENSSDTSENEIEHRDRKAIRDAKRNTRKAMVSERRHLQRLGLGVDEDGVDSKTHSSYLSDSERENKGESGVGQISSGLSGEVGNDQFAGVLNMGVTTEPEVNLDTEQELQTNNLEFHRFDSFKYQTQQQKLIIKSNNAVPSDITINLVPPDENAPTQRGQNEAITQEAEIIAKPQNFLLDQHPAKLDKVPHLSSSTSQLEDYMMQVKNSTQRLHISLTSVIFFYSFKYILVFPLTLYNIIFIPLQMGFSIPFQGWYLFIEILTILTYTADIVFILREYLKMKKDMKTHIVPAGSMDFEMKLNNDKDDLEFKMSSVMVALASAVLSMIPFSLIFSGVTDVLFIVNFLRIIRLIKLQPLYKVLNYLKRYSVRSIRVLEIILAYYIVAHIVSGVMISVGLAQANNIENTWMNKIPVPLPDGSPRRNEIQSIDKRTIYIHAIYFAANTISHVAIGDLTSVNTNERALNAFIIWCFTFFYAFLFANISSVFSGGNNFLSFNQKYQYVLQTIPKDKLNSSIIKKINIYYEHLWSKTQGFNEEADIMRPLPSQIMYDSFRERYMEAIENSILFKTIIGTTDLPVLNSFIELIQVKVYMPREFIIKAGSYGSSLYFILDGEAVIIGLGNTIVGILKPGSHYNIDIGTGEDSKDTYYGKRIFHLVSQSQTSVAVISKDDLRKLFEAFPYWKQLVRKLNYLTHERQKTSLEEHLAPIVRLDPYCDEFKIELQTIEQHLTESNKEVYKSVLKILDLEENSFILNQNTHQYRKNDILRLQRRMLEQDGNINKQGQDILKQSKMLVKRISKTKSIQFVHMTSLNQNQGDSEIETEFKWSDFIFNFYFSRSSKVRTFVDFIHMVNLIFIAFSVPIEIAYIRNVDVEIFLILEMISIIIQLIAIILNFRTPVFYYGGYTLDIKAVTKNYMQNGLIYDVMGALPINLILGYLKLQDPNIILISAIRCTRMISLLKLLDLFEKLQIYLKNHSVFMVVCKAVLFLFLLWHWTSCMWFFINILEEDLYDLTWIKKFSIYEKKLGQQYLLSVYYVIKIVTGVGQGDMIAYNNLERIVFCIIINIGDALFAIAFGLIAEVQHHVFENSEFQQYLSKLKEVEHFLVSVNAEDRQRSRVESFYQYNYNTKASMQLVEVKDLKDYLPFSLLNEVIYSSYKEILAPVFEEVKSENLMKELSILLQNTIYMPGDYIIQKDQEGDEMYFIIEGLVQVIGGDQTTVLATLSKGQCFGEIAIFLKIKRIAFVQAKTFCIISILRKTDIDRIILSFPSLEKELKEQAKKRLANTLRIEEQRFNKARQQDQESYDESFENALVEGNQNQDNASEHTDHTHVSLVKGLKQQADNQPEISNFIQRISQSRKGGSKSGAANMFSQARASSNESSSNNSPPFNFADINTPPPIRKSTTTQDKIEARPQSNNLLLPPVSGFNKKKIIEKKSTEPTNIFISVEQLRPMSRRLEKIQSEEDNEAKALDSKLKRCSGKTHTISYDIVQSEQGKYEAQDKKAQELCSSSSSEDGCSSVNDIYVNDSLTNNDLESERRRITNMSALGNREEAIDNEIEFIQTMITPNFLIIPQQQRQSTKMKRHSSLTRHEKLLLGNNNEESSNQIADNKKFIQSPPQRDSSLAVNSPRNRAISIDALANRMSPNFCGNLNTESNHLTPPGVNLQAIQSLPLQQNSNRMLSHSRRMTVVNVPRKPLGLEDLLPQKQLQQKAVPSLNRQSIFLFKQAMETIQEEHFDQKSALRGTTMRVKSKKTVQRRLSKIQLGKNLMLSKTSGLKLQWTVGY